MAVEFRVLGDIEMRVYGECVAMGHARQLCVLAALIHDIGTAVSVDQLLSRVWDENQPKGGRKALYGYLTRLRRNLRVAEGITIVREGAGYVLTGDGGMVDLHRFRRLIAEARAAGKTVRRTGDRVDRRPARDPGSRAVRRDAGPQRRRTEARSPS